MTYTISQLTAAGGVEWQKGGHHRVYFNDLAALVGLEVRFFKTGNISAAKLKGTEMSNTKATRMYNNLTSSKFYFDMADGKFHSDMMPQFFAIVRDAITSKIDEAV